MLPVLLLKGAWLSVWAKLQHALPRHDDQCIPISCMAGGQSHILTFALYIHEAL